MFLNLEQMRAITCGVAHMEEKDGFFRFYRFTEAQTEAYLNRGIEDFWRKNFATSGVRLAFSTDSRHFSFTWQAGYGSSRGFCWFDLYIDGQLCRHFGVDSADVTEAHARLELGEGNKTVELYFPWSRTVAVKDVALEDGATLQPIKRRYNMIAFGDSITQGYDASFPSSSYACTVARLLDADLIDKGIGGDRFFPALSALRDPVDPDFITVAYGTNDWSVHTRERVAADCRAFYENLSKNYPNAKIFAVTPIYRNDWQRTTGFGSPTNTVDALIRELCADLPNVTVLNGWRYIPATKEFFAPDFLHPNDLGFSIYAQNLYRDIIKEL